MEEKPEEKSEENIEEKREERKKNGLFFWQISTVIFAMLFAISAGINFFLSPAQATPQVTPPKTEFCSEEIKQSVMNFINTNFIGNGERAYLLNSSKDSFCTIFTSYRNSEIPVYVLGNKLLLIPVQNLGRGRKVYLGVSLEEEKLVKSEKPEVKLFVMSFCPFGRKALEFMKDVYPLLKDKANIEVHYLISPGNATHCLYGYCSLHGLSEIREDLREICVHKIYGWDKYWKYIACNLERCTMDNIEECWKECANQTGISAEEIENCMETKGREYLSEEFVHIVSGQLLGYGSPTLVINNKKIEGLVYRSAEELKERICEAFITQPEECKTEIGTASSASAISGTCK